MTALKKQDAQVVGLQVGEPFLFLESLPRLGGGWFANKSLQATQITPVPPSLRYGATSSFRYGFPVGPASAGFWSQVDYA